MMDTYHVVLYVHFVALMIGIGAAGVMFVTLFQLRASTTLAEAALWGQIAGKTEKAFPIAVIGLFGSGAYLTHDLWTWGTGWIEVSVAGLALVALQGPLLAGRRAHALKQALMANGPGLLGEDARRMTRDPILWIVTYANPAIVLAIMWNMTEKPSRTVSLIAIVIAYAVGAAIALQFTKAPEGAMSAEKAAAG